MAQEVERVVHRSEGWWFDPLMAARLSILRQDTEQIVLDGCQCVSDRVAEHGNIMGLPNCLTVSAISVYMSV